MNPTKKTTFQGETVMFVSISRNSNTNEGTEQIVDRHCDKHRAARLGKNLPAGRSSARLCTARCEAAKSEIVDAFGSERYYSTGRLCLTNSVGSTLDSRRAEGVSPPSRGMPRIPPNFHKTRRANALCSLEVRGSNGGD